MDDVLLPDERVLEAQPANLLLGIDLAERHAPTTRSGAIQVTVEALGRFIEGRAIGGQLYLTNLRFYFEAHGLNWTQGSYSIFLPTILGQLETDGLISDQLAVQSRAAVHKFVVRNAKAFVDTLQDAIKQAPSMASLRATVTAELPKVGKGLETAWPGPSPSTEMVQVIAQSVEAKETDALQALAVLTALELFID